RAGERQCSPDGTGFGECAGEVTPTSEDCAVPGDEDCDGVGCSDLIWAKLWGDQDNQSAAEVAIDPMGHIVIAGSLKGSTDFGGGPLISAGDSDVFLVKLDAGGGHLWSRRFGDVSFQAPQSVTVDAEGNIIVAGSFEGVLDLGGASLVSAGEEDIFVAKFDASGAHVWSERFSDNELPFEVDVVDVAVGSDGDVIVAGDFEDTINFGNGNLVSSGYADIFLAKLAGATGAVVWSKRFGDASEQLVERVMLDSSDSIYLTGRFWGSFGFGGGSLTAVMPNPDIYLAKFDTMGAHAWSKKFGGTSISAVADLDVDQVGDVVLTGAFTQTISFGVGGLTAEGSSDNMFVAKFSTMGAPMWSRRFGSSVSSYDVPIKTDAARNMVIGCHFNGTIDFGGGELAALGSSTMCLAKLDADGQHVWSKRIGDAGPDVSGLAVDPGAGEIVMAGGQSGSVDYGQGPLVSAGSFDVLVAKLAP
ncbi:MAG: hypothetical protein IT372_42410, partial [Polyangiaceae bacterium]|nr:hypothetical protein [Polyangiaceae bacterium]